MRRKTDRHTDKDTQTAVANIHFASAVPHAKCNEPYSNFVKPTEDLLAKNHLAFLAYTSKTI